MVKKTLFIDKVGTSIDCGIDERKEGRLQTKGSESGRPFSQYSKRGDLQNMLEVFYEAFELNNSRNYPYYTNGSVTN